VTGCLKDRWQEVWRKFHVEAPPSVFDELVRAYSAADRFYHNLTHIEDCLAVFTRTSSLAVHPEEVELAIWFHDAVYDTHRDDNEQKSADWAGEVVSQDGLNENVAARVSALILATRHPVDIGNADAQLLADVDLSIFGANADAFWRYEENIRQEYAWVPESVFRRKRGEILCGFLSRPHIYYHEQYRDAFERKARLHLKRAVMKLSGNSS
jgi:predicted metal-dependent HD superfamily phosphohydrolase